MTLGRLMFSSRSTTAELQTFLQLETGVASLSALTKHCYQKSIHGPHFPLNEEYIEVKGGCFR